MSEKIRRNFFLPLNTLRRCEGLNEITEERDTSEEILLLFKSTRISSPNLSTTLLIKPSQLDFSDSI
jgi:hypothetical protein